MKSNTVFNESIVLHTCHRLSMSPTHNDEHFVNSLIVESSNTSCQISIIIFTHFTFFHYFCAHTQTSLFTGTQKRTFHRTVTQHSGRLFTCLLHHSSAYKVLWHCCCHNEFEVTHQSLSSTV